MQGVVDMDVVICMVLKDILLLKKNLYYIQKNINPERIFIISDSRNFRYLKNASPNIFFIDENKLIDGLTLSAVKELMVFRNFKYHNYGWYFQQLLKLGFALSSDAKDDYLVWDADTIPFNALTFKDGNKKLIFPKWEHHQAYFDTIDKLFVAPKKANYSFISEHMLFDTSIVKKMLSMIQENYKDEWWKSIMAAVDPSEGNGFSEFETYGTFCLNYYPDIFQIRHLRTFRYCGKMFGIFVTTKEIEFLASELDTGSFEMRDYPTCIWRFLCQKFYNYICKFVLLVRTSL